MILNEMPIEYFFDECGPGVAETVRHALKDLEARGAVLSSRKFSEAAASAQWMANGGVNVPEGYALISSEFTDWIETLDATVWSRLSTYSAMETAEYLKRMREIEPARVRAHAQLEGLDVIATPTTRITAPTAEQIADLEDYRRLNMAAGRNLMLMNLWDFPSITLPVGKDPNGMPIGLQLSSARGTDDVLLGIARAVERAPPLLPVLRYVLGRDRSESRPEPLLASGVRVRGELDAVPGVAFLESLGEELEHQRPRDLGALRRDDCGDAAERPQRNALLSFSKNPSSRRYVSSPALRSNSSSSARCCSLRRCGTWTLTSTR